MAKGTLPDWLKSRLMKESARDTSSGFLPDKGAFDANLEAQLNEIFARLPVSIEQFNTDLASRGIFGAGEAPKALYSDVFAPIARAGASATAASNLGYAQLSQQGQIAGEQLRLGALNTLTGAVTQDEQARNQPSPWMQVLGQVLGTGVSLAAFSMLGPAGAAVPLAQKVQSV